MSLFESMYASILTRAYRARNDEEGQGLAEYGLILALVSVVCAAALTVLQGGISNTLNSVSAKL